jgi:hypothetical protein
MSTRPLLNTLRNNGLGFTQSAIWKRKITFAQ